jgi:hypothetical protein
VKQDICISTSLLVVLFIKAAGNVKQLFYSFCHFVKASLCSLTAGTPDSSTGGQALWGADGPSLHAAQ